MSKNTEMIEKLKHNFTGWGGLTCEEKNFLIENWAKVLFKGTSPGYVWEPVWNDGFNKGSDTEVYRLAPHFKDPAAVDVGKVKA